VLFGFLFDMFVELICQNTQDSFGKLVEAQTPDKID